MFLPSLRAVKGGWLHWQDSQMDEDLSLCSPRSPVLYTVATKQLISDLC